VGRNRGALVVVALVFVMLVGGFGPVHATTAPPDSMIVPAVRLGAVHVGQTPEEVRRTLGTPLHTTAGSVAGTINYEYSNASPCAIDEVQFTAPPGVQVLAVSTLSHICATAKGIRVGSSGMDVVSAYGKGGPGYVETRLQGGAVNVWYKNLGIAFVVSSRDTVVRVQVRKSGR